MSRFVKEWLSNNNITLSSVVRAEFRLKPHQATLGRAGEMIRTRKYKKQIEHRQGIKEEWTKIPVNRISTLIDSMPKRCADVIHFLGLPLVIDLNFAIAVSFGIKKAKKMR